MSLDPIGIECAGCGTRAEIDPESLGYDTGPNDDRSLPHELLRIGLACINASTYIVQGAVGDFLGVWTRRGNKPSQQEEEPKQNPGPPPPPVGRLTYGG